MADEISGNPVKIEMKQNLDIIPEIGIKNVSEIEFNKSRNRDQIKKVITRKKQRLSIQTNLFETNINRLKIDKNIQFFLEFWQQYYPDVYDDHLALNHMHTVGIADNSSSIIKKRTEARFDFNLQIIKPVFQKLEQIMKNGRYDDIKIEVFSKSLIRITPLDNKFSIIFDKLNNLGYNSKKRKYNKVIKKELYSTLWGSSYVPVNSGLLQKKNNDGSSIFIRHIESKSLEKKIMTHYLRYAGYFSIGNINSIFENLLEFERFQNISQKSLENKLENLEVYFSDGFLKFNPKFSKKRKKQWFIFLAARKE